MNGDLCTLREITDLAFERIRKMNPLEKAKLRIHLREHYHLPPQIEPLVHEFRPEIPKNSTGD